MRITVHSVAGKMPGWVDAGVQEYSKRLPGQLKLNWRSVPLARRGADPRQLRQREGDALLKGVHKGAVRVALERSGRAWSTQDLARRLDAWMLEGRDVAFLVGGPEGLSEACLAAAAQRWSLGPLTLPHALVRIVLAEQLYRAWTIAIGHPYHRA